MKKLGLLCVLLVTVLLATCGLPDSNQTWRVQYKVTGSARNADITISIPGGGTEQRLVAIPYASQTYTFKGMDLAYISAQNKSEYGDVTTEIIVNGSTLKEGKQSRSIHNCLSELAGKKQGLSERG